MITDDSLDVSAVDSVGRSIGSEPLGAIQLDALARKLSDQLQVVRGAPDRGAIQRKEFEADVLAIERAYELAVARAKEAEPNSPVADWLLDNFYVVREQIRDIREHLPPSFFRELPKLSDGRARVHVVARVLLSHCDSALDEELIVRFVDEFQSKVELTIGEIWAFPIMLRLALIETLRAICAQLVLEYQSECDVENALNYWRDNNRFNFSEGSCWQCIPTLISLNNILHERESNLSDASASLEQYVHSCGWNMADLGRLEQHRLAANQVSVGNIITSMRLIATLDWISFFELTNRSERILRKDPTRVYAAMDFPSRNRYREAIEKLARRSGVTETSVAAKALELAQEQVGKAENSHSALPELLAARSHIGYWLVDEGRHQIEEAIRYRPSLIEGVRRWIRRHAQLTYFGGLSVLIIAMAASLLLAAKIWNIPFYVAALLTVLAVGPISEMALQLVNAVITLILPVHLLPKLEFRDGVSSGFPTFVVVPSMLTSKRETQALLAKLENHYLANAEPTFLFALLTDFTDAPQSTIDSDREILQDAVEGIRRLNDRYATSGKPPFYLFHRERLWNESENKWMGWERKRGKLMEFGELLSGSRKTSYVVQEGDLHRLEEFRRKENSPFVITLDADTLLPRGAAQRLVGTLAHPLNRPIFANDGSTSAMRGYTILQPRVSIHLGDKQKSRYLRVHAVNPGIDPYASAASDVYQDLFGDGSFTGKGIYDLRAFERTLGKVFPENQILSHDLIEGCYARVALVSDIEVFDGYPSRYDIDSKRLHRWVRGDWQISPWLLSNVPAADGFKPNTLSILSRWKIVDNLRRSLVAPLLLTFLITGWLADPRHAWWWTILGALAIFFRVLVQVFLGLLGWTTKRAAADQLGVIAKGMVETAEPAFYAACFLPHRAFQMLDAISRTLYRVNISRRNLLEWETAAMTESRLSKGRWLLVRQLSVCSLVAILTLFIIPDSAKIGAAPWLIIWLFAPLIGQLISLPLKGQVIRWQLEDKNWLRQVASGTWSFFERYVNAEGNWLPPDNVQEYPVHKVALRISPTNEGLFLVSALVARRFGFIGVGALTDLWEKNLASWYSLEQLHGHHFNWYETAELRPLHPYYVSTVDSGNLVACYLTLRDGIKELCQEPLICEHVHSGARASLHWLRERLSAELNIIVEDAPSDNYVRAQYSEFGKSLGEIEESIKLDSTTFSGVLGFTQSLKSAAVKLNRWNEAQASSLRNVDVSLFKSQVKIVADRFFGICADVDQFMPWLSQVAELEGSTNRANDAALAELFAVLTPCISLREIRQIPGILAKRVHDLSREDSNRSVCLELNRLIAEGAMAASAISERLIALGDSCESAAFKTDFKFLYNSRQKLFSIGFNADIGKLDRAHYDLLCSECRIASYLAIAKGDVETEHWFRLGRQATEISGRYSLLSWGGSMFEFLMPQLFQRSYEGSLLDTSCRTAIEHQAMYGRKRGVPWGISESGYSAMASNSDYQYKSFGVPGLGLKRGLAKDLVVSPYSTVLAIPFAPHSATENLKRLATVALGKWGFYEAVDYTTSRLRRKQAYHVVRNYMAHHQGMSLLALANALHENVLIEWFHSHPLVRANELLLQERVPAFVGSHVPNPDDVEPANTAREESSFFSRQIVGVHANSPRTLILSNGQFNSLLTHTGGGCARWNDVQVNRWRSDPTRDPWGNFIYLRDRNTSEVWSATYHPTRVEPDAYHVLFSVDKGEIHRRQGDIETSLEVVVSPEHNAEVRQLRITNHGSKSRQIEVTSYCEVVLTSQAADIAHPAFQKLFVETEFVAEDATLIARRRPRDAGQSPLFALHTLALPTAYTNSIDYESSRERFLGRNRTPETPEALELESLSKTTGAVLDPIFSLRCVVTIEPAEAVTLGFTTAIAPTREQALTMADLYHELRGVQRAIEMAWAFAQVELRHLNVTPKQVHLYQQLGGFLLYLDPGLRGDAIRISANRLGQRALWRFGISGDVPILLLRITDASEIELVKEVVAAQTFLISRGLRFELVICNDYPGTYFDLLQDQLQSILNARHIGEAVPQSLFLLRGSQLSVEDQQLLDAVASVLLRGNRGSLAQQLETATIKGRANSIPGNSRVRSLEKSKRGSRYQPAKSNEREEKPKTGEFANGFGRFTDQGRRYEMTLSPGEPTPAPWSNTIANSGFGCLITESGGGYTWFGNSRENKLTAWSNDPVSDTPSEIIYVRDIHSGEHWFPIMPLEQELTRRVVHGQGYSIFSSECDSIQSETLVTVHASLPLKFVRMRLHNAGENVRQLQVTYYAETVLGVSREVTAMCQASSFDVDHNALLMCNGYHPDLKSQVMFLKPLGGKDLSWTADRRSFLGRNGSYTDPVGLKNGLNRHVGAGFDPCLAIQATIAIEPGGTEELIFLLGATEERSQAMELLDQHREPSTASDAILSAIEQWNETLSVLSVQTPNNALDLLVNRWLPYQVLSCRIWGRSAFYQSGGAYGFRDQLQDVMAVVHVRPDVAREHILKAASRQYIEGDVQHWWHPHGGNGVRTHFSDDFLFLPFVTMFYVNATGDQDILQELVPFIESPPLTQYEQERYEQPVESGQRTSLLEHCKRSIAHGLRYGSHDLPLMGGGDWNDGMNKVGEGGQGESVWVAWFQIVIFDGFANLLRALGDAEVAESYTTQAARLRDAIEQHCWDGKWYRRAFFDDGTPLGSQTIQECQIDSLTQSWAVIANGPTERGHQAFQSAIERLVVPNSGIVLLFAPPFDKSALDPGYIKGYLPGVRENGGQYSHAAMWMIQAATILGDGNLAVKLFDMLNPIHHSDTHEKAMLYKVEPYVIAADVYANEQHVGRGGWTWYTGSASWMYRAAIEYILGIQIQKNQLSVQPTLPSDWNEFRFTYRRRGTTWHVHVLRSSAVTAQYPSTFELVYDEQVHEETLGFV